MSTLTIAVENTIVPIVIHTIATHFSPHIDEICGILLLRKFGSKHFPCIETAGVVFWSEGGPELQTYSAEEYLKRGTLLVGIGDSMFNEHPTLNANRKEKHCAATLIAEYLGLDDDPALELLLDAVRCDDLNGGGGILGLGHLCRKMYNMMPTEKVMTWANLALEAVYREQAQFAQEAMKEYCDKAKVSIVRNGTEQNKVVVIESDNEVVARFARATRGGGATLVIQKQSSGNVQIFSNRKFHPNMEKIARFIRLAEQKAKGKMVTLNPEQLEREGSVPGAENWHFFKKGRMLLNGSLSHPKVPPTKIPLEEIARIVCNCAF